MTIYLNVSARRIQSWIVRASRLKFIRGASKALTEATCTETINQWLRDQGLHEVLEIAADAGQVDGVVSLRVQDENTSLPNDFEPYASYVWALIEYLQHRLPGVEWGGWIEEAPTYVDAYRRFLFNDSRPTGCYMSSFPADVNVPVAQSCESCQQEHQSAEEWIEDDDDAALIDEHSSTRVKKRSLTLLGPDCMARLDAAKRSLSEAADPSKREAWGFPELATLGADPSPEMNHLATIAADGNRMGEIFEAILDFPAEVRRQAARAVGEATVQATEDARRAVDRLREGERILPDIPHYVGGDDILVSVQARLAWPYAVTLAEAFERHLSSQWQAIAQTSQLTDLQSKTLRDLVSKVGLGIGIVFAHHSHPFWNSYQMAEQAVRVAKTSTAGLRSAVSWINLTVEEEIPPYRYQDAHGLRLRLARTAPQSRGLVGFSEAQQTITRRTAYQDQVLTGWTGSQRQTALSILRDLWHPERVASSVGEASRDAERKRNKPVITTLMTWSDRHDGLLWPDLTNIEHPGSDEDVAVLANLLSMQRWWPSS